MAVRAKSSITAKVVKIGDYLMGTEEKKEAVRVNFGHLVF